MEDLTRPGRPKRLTDTEARSIVREVKANPVSSAVQIAKHIAETSGKPISASTIRRTLHKSGLHGRVPRKKPYISKTNQQKRLEFAKKYINEPVNFWNNILYTDESKFEIFESKKPPKIWR